MNIEDMTPAQQKAVEAGGTNNAIIGNSLVKRGIMEKFAVPGDHTFKFVLTAEYMNVRDARQSLANEAKIDALREEYKTASPERQETIVMELAQVGAVVFPQGSPEHEEYRARLTAELAKLKAEQVDGFTEISPGVRVMPLSDAKQRFAEAVDANDQDTMAEIINEAAPEVVTRDPNAVRYEEIPKWTDERLLDKKEDILRRLSRRTLRGADRRLSENRLNRIQDEIEKRRL